MEVVVTPAAGATDKEIQAAMDSVVKAGGGRVIIKPGEYVFHRGLLLQNARDVSIVGGPGVRLKFAPEVCAVTAADAAKGQDFVEVESAEKIAAGMGLEIQANDVRCTHGATSGHLDEEQMFYLRSRGLPVAAARELLVAGFFEDVLAKIEDEDLRGALRDVIRTTAPR